MARDLDETGERLLALLKKDARRPVAALARELNLSRSAIQDRIARLERDGRIAGYTVVEERHTKGHAALASVTISDRPCEPVLRRLRTVPRVERVFSMAGDIDAVVLVRCDTAGEVSRTADELSAVSGVNSVSMRTVLGER